MLLYILCFIILLIILFFIYIRLKYRFWAIQPVFHFYDLYYWIINVGIIRHELPEKNKYVNLTNIKTNTFNGLDELTKKSIALLIKLNYLRNGENKYEPTMANIEPYFVGHSDPCYWSYFIDKELFIDNKTNKTIEENRIIGVISSRPLHVNIKSNSFDIYYVDFLCVSKNHRKRNIAPQLIQTHEYNQSHNNRNICVSLFKREEELTGIVPLTIYKTYCFNMNKIHIEPELNTHVTILTADKQNMYYLYNHLNEIKTKWDITIYPNISNLIELVSTKNMYIKMLLIDGDIDTIYVFRKTCVYIEGNKEIISCIASIKGDELTNLEFVKYFKLSLYSILNEPCDNKNNFTYLTIEDVSDNRQLISNICETAFPLAVSPMAYFFYNFAHNSFQSNKCLILN